MLKKNLIYTGLTRAKQSLWFLGSHQAFVYGITHKQDERRKTTLIERMKKTPEISLYDFE